MNKTTFFFVRLPIAISLLGHGLVRVPKLNAFSEWMVSTMEKSVLPMGLVSTWGYLLPFIEVIIGLLLFIGFKPKQTIYAGLALMSILIFGSSAIENWGAIEAQLIHAIYLFALLWFVEKNNLANNHIKQ